MLKVVGSGDALEKNTRPGDKNSPRNSHPQTQKTTMAEVCPGTRVKGPQKME